jgi:5-methylcytosine-specific restriction enzyme subunit McrC
LFQTAEPTALTENYRPLFDLCRLLADGLTPGERAGKQPCPAFLLDMERVFEHYCVSSCVRVWHSRPEIRARYSAAVQPLHRIGDLSMRPDLVLQRDNTPVLVLDAKWKKDAVQQDIYQVLAYSAALGVRQAVLVYPGRHDSKRTYLFEAANITLTIRKVRVLGSREQCQRSARLLAQRVYRAGASDR